MWLAEHDMRCRVAEGESMVGRYHGTVVPPWGNSASGWLVVRELCSLVVEGGGMVCRCHDEVVHR